MPDGREVSLNALITSITLQERSANDIIYIIIIMIYILGIYCCTNFTSKLVEKSGHLVFTLATVNSPCLIYHFEKFHVKSRMRELLNDV